MTERDEQGLLRGLIAQSAAGTLDEGILLGLLPAAIRETNADELETTALGFSSPSERWLSTANVRAS